MAGVIQTLAYGDTTWRLDTNGAEPSLSHQIWQYNETRLNMVCIDDMTVTPHQTRQHTVPFQSIRHPM